MKTADERAASIRRRAKACEDPRQSAMLHRLADEAGSIRILPGVSLPDWNPDLS